MNISITYNLDIRATTKQDNIMKDKTKIEIETPAFLVGDVSGCRFLHDNALSGFVKLTNK